MDRHTLVSASALATALLFVAVVVGGCGDGELGAPDGTTDVRGADSDEGTRASDDSGDDQRSELPSGSADATRTPHPRMRMVSPPPPPPTQIPAPGVVASAPERVVAAGSAALDHAAAEVGADLTGVPPLGAAGWVIEDRAPPEMAGIGRWLFHDDRWDVFVTHDGPADQVDAFRVNVTQLQTGRRWRFSIDAGGRIVSGEIEVEPTSEADVERDLATGWRVYRNSHHGYRILHPPGTDVVAIDQREAVRFYGEWEAGSFHPWLEIAHRSSGFFRPPSDTDLRGWVDGQIQGYELRDPAARIDGLQALRIHFDATTQAPEQHIWYVARDEQLFVLTVLATRGGDDGDLAERFAGSLVFEGDAPAR